MTPAGGYIGCAPFPAEDARCAAPYRSRTRRGCWASPGSPAARSGPPPPPPPTPRPSRARRTPPTATESDHLLFPHLNAKALRDSAPFKERKAAATSSGGAADPVIWTKPDDVTVPLQFAPGALRKKFGSGEFPGGGHVVFWDGTVRFLRDSVPEATLGLLCHTNDGRAIPAGTFDDRPPASGKPK